MNALELTQEEADTLLQMRKKATSAVPVMFPAFVGGSIHVDLVSENEKEDFILDIYRARVDLQKVTYQNRAKRIIILARLDIGGSPHQNPDGIRIECPHLHLYRTGFADKWAYELPADKFSNHGTIHDLLNEFMDYCNIVEKPNIPHTLF